MTLEGIAKLALDAYKARRKAREAMELAAEAQRADPTASRASSTFWVFSEANSEANVAIDAVMRACREFLEGTGE